ncbi:hypothetical protein [Flexivirga alba]|uniref:Uncharacterized protein n=1 Tax=Flexivirga alba TaxID=702742 RepID=A0ABW2AA63_9MICO
MGVERVTFRAGRDLYGDAVWLPGSIHDREQREDGEWFCVLPAFAGSDDDAQWVRGDDIRMPNQQPDDGASDIAEPVGRPRLRVVD